MRGPPLIACLLLGTLASGCFSAVDDLLNPLPDDPNALSYVLRASHPDKAAHPVAYEGRVGGLSTGNVPWSIPASRVELHPQGVAGVTLPSPSAPEARVWNASGTLTTGSGTFTFSDAELVVTSTRSFALIGDATVRSTVETTFAPGRVTVSGLPMLAGVAAHAGRVQTGLSLEVRSQTETGEAVSVRFARGAPEGFPQGGATGTLALAPAADVPVHVQALTLEATTTLETAPAGVSRWTLTAPAGELTLRGAKQGRADGSLLLVESRGSLDLSTLRLGLTGAAKQWSFDGRPQFQASLALSTVGTASVTVARGENASVWVSVSESGRVGTAVGVRPTVKDTAGLEAGTGPDWYASADPHLLEVFADGFKQMAFAPFIDFRIVDFDPGETKYIPLYVGAPSDMAPGDYTVRLQVKGHNALSTLEIPVKVT